MSVPALTNVRLITILAASLLAGYAGDEALNAWWSQVPQPGSSSETLQAGGTTPDHDLALASGKLIAN